LVIKFLVHKTAGLKPLLAYERDFYI